MTHALTLTFDDHTLDVIDRLGKRWLRGDQIGHSLALVDPRRSVQKIFRRHRSEFTSDMTDLVEMPTAGGRQLTRIFSARGAALIAMLASTEPAARFRAWVLDVLEGRSAEQGGIETLQRLRRYNHALSLYAVASRPLWCQILWLWQAEKRKEDIRTFLCVGEERFDRVWAEMAECGLVPCCPHIRKEVQNEIEDDLDHRFASEHEPGNA